MIGHWNNATGIKNLDPKYYIGFVYVIEGEDWFYIGRKQFRIGRTKRTERESNWRTYTSSSKTAGEYCSNGEGSYRMLAVFTNRAYLNYAEATAIILTKSCEPGSKGINGEIEKFRGRLTEIEANLKQLTHLQRECVKIRKKYENIVSRY